MQPLGKNIIIDWIAFTIKNNEISQNRLMELVKGHKVDHLDYGRLGYNAGWKIGVSGWAYYHTDKREAGIHVILPGSMLAHLDFRPLQLINILRDWQAKFTRIDLAMDDFEGLLNLDVIYAKLLSCDVQTRFRKVKKIGSGDIGSLEAPGQTINIGARSSESYVRIYDKRQERIAAGENSDKLPENWIRVELEIKGKKSQAIADILGDCAMASGEGAGDKVGGLLYGLVDFKDPHPTDTNKSRWSTCDWWAKFVGQVSKLKISLPKKEKTIETSKAWVYNQVKTTLAMIVLSFPDVNNESGYDFIVRCILDGQARMSKAQKQMIVDNTAQLDLL